MDKRAQEFIDLFIQSVEEVKKLKSLGELSVTSDSCFGGIVRTFGKANILSHLAMLAASEIQITNFSEEKINEIKEKYMDELKKPYKTDESVDELPSKKKDLN